MHNMTTFTEPARVLSPPAMICTDCPQLEYRTSAANFHTIINQTLLKDARFKKARRGQYTVE